MKKVKKSVRSVRNSVEAYACMCTCACSCQCGCDTIAGSFVQRVSANTNGANKTSVLTAAANEI